MEMLHLPGRIVCTFLLGTLFTVAFLEVMKRLTGKYSEFFLGVKAA